MFAIVAIDALRPGASSSNTVKRYKYTLTPNQRLGATGSSKNSYHYAFDSYRAPASEPRGAPLWCAGYKALIESDLKRSITYCAWLNALKGPTGELNRRQPTNRATQNNRYDYNRADASPERVIDLEPSIGGPWVASESQGQITPRAQTPTGRLCSNERSNCPAGAPLGAPAEPWGAVVGSMKHH